MKTSFEINILCDTRGECPHDGIFTSDPIDPDKVGLAEVTNAAIGQAKTEGWQFILDHGTLKAFCPECQATRDTKTT